MKKIIVLSALSLLFVSTPSFAKLYDPYINNEGKFYMQLSGDATFIRHSEIRTQNTSGRLDYNTGGGGNLAFGYNISNNIRFDIEGGYHILSIQKATLNNVETANSSGSVKIASAMANIYYDFQNCVDFTPYLGIGAGDSSITIPQNIYDTRKDNSALKTYQIRAGIAYTSPAMPSVNWYLGYRYVTIEAPSFAIRNSSSGQVLNFRRMDLHNAELGFRYNF